MHDRRVNVDDATIPYHLPMMWCRSMHAASANTIVLSIPLRAPAVIHARGGVSHSGPNERNMSSTQVDGSRTHRNSGWNPDETSGADK